MYSAEIIADSISPDGIRLTTYETEWPHAVHKDFMTHTFPKNFESFRAQPPEKLITKLEDGGFFIPEVFGHRTPGMGQRNDPLEGEEAIDQDWARELWIKYAMDSIWTAKQMLKRGISKQQINFVIQDLCSIRGVVTATEWDNFFGLRADADNVRPEVGKVARMMDALHASEQPRLLDYGQWHLPFTTLYELQWAYEDDDRQEWDHYLKVSTGRTARISYTTHRGVRNQSEDVRLHDDLLSNGHMSPTGHQATPIPLSGVQKYVWRSVGGKKFKFNGPDWSGALYGWAQYRKSIPHEENYRELRQHVQH